MLNFIEKKIVTDFCQISFSGWANAEIKKQVFLKQNVVTVFLQDSFKLITLLLPLSLTVSKRMQKLCALSEKVFL